jgi:hypothetical protein
MLDSQEHLYVMDCKSSKVVRPLTDADGMTVCKKCESKRKEDIQRRAQLKDVYPKLRGFELFAGEFRIFLT